MFSMKKESNMDIDIGNGEEDITKVETSAEENTIEKDSAPVWTCFENLLLVVSARVFQYDWNLIAQNMLKYNSSYPREAYSISKCQFQLKKILDTVGQQSNTDNEIEASPNLGVAETNLVKQVVGVIGNSEPIDPHKEVDYLYYSKDLERLEDMEQEIPEEELTQMILDATDDESESESSDEAINDLRLLRRKVKADMEAKKRIQDSQIEVSVPSMTCVNEIDNSASTSENPQSSTVHASSPVSGCGSYGAVTEVVKNNCGASSTTSVSFDIKPLDIMDTLKQPITQSTPEQCNNYSNGGSEKKPQSTVDLTTSMLTVMEEPSKLEDWKADLDKVCLPAKCEYFDSNDIDSIQATFVPDSDIIHQVEAEDLMSIDPPLLQENSVAPIISVSVMARIPPTKSIPEFKIPDLPAPKKTSSPPAISPSQRNIPGNGALEEIDSQVLEIGLEETPAVINKKPSSPTKRRSKLKRRKSPKKLKVETNGCGSGSSVTNSGSPKKATKVAEMDPDFQAFRKSINLIHDRIMCHKHANLFKEQVKDSVAPGYSKAVKKPVCMKSIKRNIENGLIRTADDYQRELNLMFLNAVMFSPDDNKFRDIAIAMAKDCFKILEEFKATQDLIKLKKTNEVAAESAGLDANEKDDYLPGRSTRCKRGNLEK